MELPPAKPFKDDRAALTVLLTVKKKKKKKKNVNAFLNSLNLDLKPIFLTSIFIVCNLVYFILTVMYFRFLLNI